MKSNGSVKKIRVLQVMDKCAIRGSPIHGVSRLLLTWWPAFRDTEFDFYLCVLRGGGGTCSAFEQIGVQVHDLGRHKLDPRTIYDLASLVRRLDIHILHCHGYGATTFGRIAGALSRRPVIVQEHMIDRMIPFYQRIADFILSPLTSAGIAVSNAVAEFMTGKRFISANKMHVIYNTIPESYCQRPGSKEKAAVRKKYGLPEGRIFIGIVGRLDPIKGHSDFLSAAEMIHEKYPETFFLVVGDGELRQKLENEARERGLVGSIAFMGHCQEVMPVISLLDVFVSCSYSEGLPMAHAEAMAQGIPVVATSVGGVPEIVEDGVSGVLVSPGHPDEIAAAVTGILADDELRNRLAEEGRRRCQDKFLVSSTVEQLGALYHRVLTYP